LNEPLRILLVDDNPDDRALAMREVRREFPDSQFQQISQVSELHRILELGRCDLMITDYQLRWSDGITVLLAVKMRWPECPVIMFTGTGNEEVAVQAMKAGLDDYVLKSPRHYARLPSAVHMALEHARQRKARRDAESRYESLFDEVPVGLFRASPDGKLMDANPSLMEMLGYADLETLQRRRALKFFTDTRARRRFLDGLRQAGEVRGFEAQFRRSDGKAIWAEVNVRAIRDARKRVQSCEGSLEDITARKRSEKQLKDSREQLRALAAYLQSVREEERTRIAREVHDELGQALTGLKMDIAWMEKKIIEASHKEDVGQFEEKLRELPGRVDAIIGAVRRIATDLRPPVLDDLGLVAAIEWQMQEFERRTGIKCEFHCKARYLELDSERATAVFRIFQETLTNIVRHADATNVTIQLEEFGGRLNLEVRDNGRGLTGGEVSNTRSLGLLGMRERATMLDGEVNIIGRRGKGTTVGVRIPLHGSVDHAKK